MKEDCKVSPTFLQTDHETRILPHSLPRSESLSSIRFFRFRFLDSLPRSQSLSSIRFFRFRFLYYSPPSQKFQFNQICFRFRSLYSPPQSQKFQFNQIYFRFRFSSSISKFQVIQTFQMDSGQLHICVVNVTAAHCFLFGQLTTN